MSNEMNTLLLKRQLSQGGFVAERARDILAKSSEDEPRDDHGRWTSGGGSGPASNDEQATRQSIAADLRSRASDSVAAANGAKNSTTEMLHSGRASGLNEAANMIENGASRIDVRSASEAHLDALRDASTPSSGVMAYHNGAATGFYEGMVALENAGLSQR